MAWFALTLRTPTWCSPAPQIYTHTHAPCKKLVFMPQTPARPADVYTLRISDADARPDLLSRLRGAVTDMGGTVDVDVVEGRGFMCVCPTSLVYVC
jgi:hypothetical protein